MKYTKNSPRLTVKFINADNEKVLFEVHDRSWMNVGELLSDYYVDNLIKTELKGKSLPENLLVLVVSEFKLE